MFQFVSLLVCNPWKSFFKIVGLEKVVLKTTSVPGWLLILLVIRQQGFASVRQGISIYVRQTPVLQVKLYWLQFNSFTLTFMFNFKKTIVVKMRYLSRLNKEFFICNSKIKYAKLYYIMIVIFIHSEIILYATFSPRTRLGRSVLQH